jgi:hypothetical protein
MPSPDDFTDQEIAQMDYHDLRRDFLTLTEAVRKARNLGQAKQAAELHLLRHLDFYGYLAAKEDPAKVRAALAAIETEATTCQGEF